MLLSQSQVQKQRLLLTNQLVQSFEMLAMNSLDLQTYVNEQLEANPMLENEDDSIGDSLTVSNDYDTYLRNRILGGKYDEKVDFDIPQRKTVRDELKEILPYSRLSDRECRCAKMIIDCLDRHGYFRDDLEEIAELCQCSAEESQKALEAVQELDPPGIGARTLEECILLQLIHKNNITEQIANLVYEHSEDLFQGHFHYLSFLTGIKEKQIKKLAAEIKECRPYPISLEEEAYYVVPEIFVEKEGNRLEVHMNHSIMPKVSINQTYLAFADKDTECREFLRDYKNSAQELIQNLSFREQTITRVTEYIVRKQKNFFLENACLCPLGIKEIAENLSLNESTISRAINEKYLFCKQGLYPLKYFLSREIKTKQGPVSRDTVKMLITEILHEEKCLTDNEIVARLREYQIQISRRTVAKYRMQMGVMSSYVRTRKV